MLYIREEHHFLFFFIGCLLAVRARCWHSFSVQEAGAVTVSAFFFLPLKKITTFVVAIMIRKINANLKQLCPHPFRKERVFSVNKRCNMLRD